jgi:predicted GH43/DUF377 family glycosyl hydrolase
LSADDVLPGVYNFVTVYRGATPRFSEPAWIYPASCTGLDSITGGNWGGAYGKDGYLLCNYSGNGSDKENLPPYVASINYYKIKGNDKPLNAIWESNTDDRRALAPDTSNSFPRNATCLYAMDADQIGYTFTSTISIKGKHDYKISLYFLDWDDRGRKIAVEMFDAATSNLISPVEIVKSCLGGAYLTYSYNKSAKFRINMVRGDNAVLSGIFFDPPNTDRRPTASLRLLCRDEGTVLRHGDGIDSCDVYGAREAIVNKVGDSFYLFYDGAGKDGWEACLAKSTDLRNWIKIGPVLPLGDSSRNDSKAASSPWIIKSKDGWHMFYLGTAHATLAPDRIPAFPYLTMKAKANAIEGPWIKQYEVNPFTPKKDSYYSLTASPGFIIKYKGAFIQFFSGSMMDGNAIKRTLGIAKTKDLNGSWKIMDKPIFPSEEQVENSSIYFDQKSKTWYLFTNHIGITKDNVEYTDAVWVFWSKDIYHWNESNKAVVLDSSNCSWAKGAIGMPSIIRVGDKLAMLYDGAPGNSIGHMKRDIGLAWIPLPLRIY